MTTKPDVPEGRSRMKRYRFSITVSTRAVAIRGTAEVVSVQSSAVAELWIRQELARLGSTLEANEVVLLEESSEETPA